MSPAAACGKEESLRSQLIGSWELIEYYTYPPNDESAKSYPAGPNARGIIMYTHDGYMSAQLQVPGQKSFGEDKGTGTEADWAELGRSYIAYTGQFYLDETGDEKGGPILMHHMGCSNMPYLVGQTQRRVLNIEDRSDGRYLVLSPNVPINQKSEEPHLARATWRRLPVNQASSSI